MNDEATILTKNQQAYFRDISQENASGFVGRIYHHQSITGALRELLMDDTTNNPRRMNDKLAFVKRHKRALAAVALSIG